MPERACLCGSRTHKNRRSRDCHLNCTQLNRHLQRGHHVLAAQEQARLDQLRLAVEAETASTSVPAIAEIVLPRNVSQGTPSAGNQVPPHLANTLRPPLLRTCVRHLCDLNPRPPDPHTKPSGDNGSPASGSGASRQHSVTPAPACDYCVTCRQGHVTARVPPPTGLPHDLCDCAIRAQCQTLASVGPFRCSGLQGLRLFSCSVITLYPASYPCVLV